MVRVVNRVQTLQLVDLFRVLLPHCFHRFKNPRGSRGALSADISEHDLVRIDLNHLSEQHEKVRRSNGTLHFVLTVVQTVVESTAEGAHFVTGFVARSTQCLSHDAHRHFRMKMKYIYFIFNATIIVHQKTFRLPSAPPCPAQMASE